jgi:membrane protease YdiL (CAAX protease family)
MSRRDAQPHPYADEGNPQWLRDLVRATPQAPLMAPFMTYLLLLLLDDVLPPQMRFISVLIRAALTLYVTWLFRAYYPPLRRACWGPAIVVGLAAAVLWVAGQHLFDRLGLGGTLSFGSLLSERPTLLVAADEPFDVAARLGQGAIFWTNVVIKIAAAVTVVPIVEELFWRGLMLRALVNWDRFETVPMGTFAWFSFLGTSLLSVLEHPANWGVSILCWFVYNALFYWTRSLTCLMVTHGITNLALYTYVVWRGGDAWRFW